MDTPELDKLSKISETSQAGGEFLEWLGAERDKAANAILALFPDLAALQAENAALLADIQRMEAEAVSAALADEECARAAQADLAALREALQGMSDLIDDKILVRDRSRDGDFRVFARESLRLTEALAKMQRALTPHPPERGATEDVSGT